MGFCSHQAQEALSSIMYPNHFPFKNHAIISETALYFSYFYQRSVA